MGRREGPIETYLRKMCEAKGWLCWKFRSPAHDGVPDRLIIAQGHVIFVETKAPGEKERALQRYQHEQMRSHGADVRTIDTYEKVNAFVDELAHICRCENAAKKRRSP